MPDTTLARAIIEIGTNGIPDAEAQLRALEADLRQVGREYDAGTIQIDEYLKTNQRLHAEIASLTAGLGAAKAAVEKFGSVQAAQVALAKQAQSGMQAYGQGIMSASFAMQDFMSANGDLVQGLYRIQNNIPMILTQLGAGSGLAGVVSMVSLGFGLLLPKIMEFVKDLGLVDEAAGKAKDEIGQLKEQIEELEKKPVKLAVDTVELDNAKRKLKELQSAQQAFDQFKGMKSDEEREVGNQIEQLIALAPGGASALADKLRQSMGSQLLANDPRLKQINKNLEAARDEVARGREGRLHPDAGANAQLTAIAEATVKKVEEVARQRRLAILGDEATGTKGEAHTRVGEIFKGATSGDDAARQKLVAELEKIGQNRLAEEIASTNRRAVAAAKAEEQEERNENSRIETNNAIRGIRKKRKENADKEAKELEQVQVDKARPVISGIVKGRDLETTATKILEDLENNKAVGPDGKPMTPEQQIEFLQEQIRGVIEEELKARGLLNKGSGRAASTTATQIAAAARTNVDRAAEKAKNDLKNDLKKEIGQTAGAFGPKINDELQAAVLNRMARGQQDAAIQRDLSKQLSQRMAGAGVNDPRVAEQAAAQIVEKVLGGLRLDLQTEGPSVQEAAQNRLSDLLRKVQGQRRNAGNARQTEALAADIEANSFAELGVQFSPEQSQAAAKKAVDLANQGVNTQAALQMALQEQLGAMNALGNQLMQQDGMLRQFAQEFQLLRRGVQTRQRTAGKRG